MRTLLGKVTAKDVGRQFFRLHRMFFGGGWGAVLLIDVNKRFYNVGGVVQIENDVQRDARVKRNPCAAGK